METEITQFDIFAEIVKRQAESGGVNIKLISINYLLTMIDDANQIYKTYDYHRNMYENIENYINGEKP